MVELDEEALVNARARSRDRKLSSLEKLAIYAFAVKGVQAPVLARVFDVNPNAIYYITKWEHTAAHRAAKESFERLGEERVWAEIVTEAQIEQVNAENRNLMNGKPINDRGHRRINRSRSRPRRARAAINVLEAASDGASERPGTDRPISG
jgi:hypothetical protein